MFLRIVLTVFVSLGLTALATSALAKGPYDGSKPLICTTHESDSCIEDEECVGGDAEGAERDSREIHAVHLLTIPLQNFNLSIPDDGDDRQIDSVRFAEIFDPP